MGKTNALSQDLAALAQALKPYILPWISAPSTVSGAGSSGLTAHALSGPYHSGLLADAQGPQFLLVDGSRQLTGNLAVAGGVTLDGVDVSAHAADADAHHSQTHTLATASGLGPDHTISGAPIGAVLRASAADAARFERLFYSDLQGAGSPLDLVGWTGTDLIGRLTPSSDVSGGASSILRSDSGALALQSLTASVRLRSPVLDTASGDLALSPASGVTTLTSLHASTLLRTPVVDTASGDLALSPASGVTTLAALHASTRLRAPLVENAAGDLKLDASTDLLRLQPSVRLQSDNYVSQVTGWGIDYTGGADFRYLFADELHAKSFIADLEQALAGGQIISKSVAVVYSSFTLPAAGSSTTLIVRDLPSAPGMAVFVNGDFVRLRKFTRAAGSLSIADAWGTVTLDTTYGIGGFDSASRTQRYTFNRSAGTDGGTASGSIAADAIVLDYGTSGNGLYEVNAIDGAYALNSPYLQFIKWTTHPRSGQVVRLRLGNLRGVTAQTDEYGLYAGSGVTDSDAYIRLSSYTNRLNNLPMEWWNGGTKAVSINATDGVNIVAPTTWTDPVRAYTFSYAGTVLAGLYGGITGTLAGLSLEARRTSVAGGDAQIHVVAESDAAGDALVRLQAMREATGAYAQMDLLGGAGRAAGWQVSDGGSTANLTLYPTYLQASVDLRLGSGKLDTPAGVATLSFRVQNVAAMSLTPTLLQAPSVDVGGTLTTQYINYATGVNLRYNGATKLATVIGGIEVTGALDVSGIVTLGGASPVLNVGSADMTTGSAAVQIGSGRTGSGAAYIDLVSENVSYPDYALRLIRAAGANGTTYLYHRGTGNFVLQATEAATFFIQTNAVTRLSVDATDVDASVPFARNGTLGYLFVPVTPRDLQDTGGTTWNGGTAKAAGTWSFDMSTAANGTLPATARALALLLSGNWAAANQSSWAGARPRGGLGVTQTIQIRGQVANINSEVCGIVATDANGDIDVVINNAQMATPVCRLVGYYV